MKRTRIYNRYSAGNRVTLYMGDCLNLMQTLDNDTVQLIVSSPPYNIGKDYEERTHIDSYAERQKEVLSECARVLKPTGSVCWVLGNHVSGNGKTSSIVPLDIIFYPLFEELGFKLRNRIIWHYGWGLHNKYRLSGRYDTISWFTLSDDYVFNLDSVRVKQKYRGKTAYKGPNRGRPSGNKKGKNPSDFWQYSAAGEIGRTVWKQIPNVKGSHIEKTEHPCQYPIALVRRLVKMLSNMNHLVMDPYAGTGTTLIGSLMEGRRALGAEKDPGYHRTAYERIQTLFENRLRYRADKPIFVPGDNEKVVREPQRW